MPIGTRDYSAQNVSWERTAVTFENAPDLQQRIKEKQAFGWEVETFRSSGPYVFYYFRRWLHNPSYQKLLELEDREESICREIYEINSPNSEIIFKYEPQDINLKAKSKAKTFAIISIVLCLILVVFSVLPFVTPANLKANMQLFFDIWLYLEIALGVLFLIPLLLYFIYNSRYKKSLEENVRQSSDEYKRSLMENKRQELLREQAALFQNAIIIKNNSLQQITRK